MSADKWLLVWFLALIVIGAMILLLPAMSPGGGLAPIDALFTAASAVSVTGLMVIDMEQDLTLAGRAVVLVLIQCGGLGIVTLASVMILSAQRRLPLNYEEMVDSTVAAGRFTSVREVARVVLAMTLAIEAVAALLMFALWPSDGPAGFASWPDRLWAAVFHSVSAFCNAGITLFSENLRVVREEPAIQLIVSVLVIIGGFGFINLQELVHRLRNGAFRWSRFSLLLKATIVLTISLNLGGALAIGLLEADVAFAGMNAGEHILAALFHAVSTRTAGFETVAISGFTAVSLMLMMALMFVGASSGSCAGGIKLSTLTVLFAVVRSYLRHDSEPVLFNRRLTKIDQRKAFVLIVASVLVFTLAVLIVYLVENEPQPLTESRAELFRFGFEVMSAMGTVGLSTGITGTLSPTGKAIIIALMIVGRLGPLAVIAAWARRPTPRPFTNPEESMPIG